MWLLLFTSAKFLGTEELDSSLSDNVRNKTIIRSVKMINIWFKNEDGTGFSNS